MRYVGFPIYQVEDSTCLNPSRLISTLEFASKLVTGKRYRQWALEVPALPAVRVPLCNKPAYSPVINHGIGQSPTAMFDCQRVLALY